MQFSPHGFSLPELKKEKAGRGDAAGQ
jgi:hypothetical protein